jgi:hypothetical protein
MRFEKNEIWSDLRVTLIFKEVTLLFYVTRQGVKESKRIKKKSIL